MHGHWQSKHTRKLGAAADDAIPSFSDPRFARPSARSPTERPRATRSAGSRACPSPACCDLSNTWASPGWTLAAAPTQQTTGTERVRSCGVATFFLSSSVRTSLRTFAHGTSAGHQMGRHSFLPQLGLPQPVEYFSISGMNVRSCACKEA